MNKSCFAGVLALLLAATTAKAQVEIVSFQSNGRLVCSNLLVGSAATVEWAPSMAGPWTNSWSGLEMMLVGSSGVLDVSVPLFYRVREVPPPVTTTTSNTTTTLNTSTTSTTSSSTTTTTSPMALIPAGSFQMGDTFADDATGDEVPVHAVSIRTFYMDRREVSKSLWDQVKSWAETNGYTDLPLGNGKGNNHPVQEVNWFDCVKWCNARAQRDGLQPVYYADASMDTVYQTGQSPVYASQSADGYRLPTEAEWEKAARGGVAGRRFPWSESDNIQHTRANYFSASSYTYDTSATRGYHPDYDVGVTPYTSPVASFAPNPYGLYDMAGNVSEWCSDWYSYGFYQSSPSTDPTGPAPSLTVTTAVVRGGYWQQTAIYCRAASRMNADRGSREITRGFRAVRWESR